MEVEQQDDLADVLIRSVKLKEIKKCLKALEKGADPNYIGPEGFAAIHLAAGLDGCTGEQLLNLLLRYGGNPNLKSLDSETALHIAVMWNQESSTRILLAHGADPTLRNSDGFTAFQLASNTSDHEQKCLEVLKSNYIDESSDSYVAVSKKTPNSTVNKTTASFPNLEDVNSIDSMEDLFSWDSDQESSTSYFSLPKDSLKGLITEIKDDGDPLLLQRVINGETSLIIGSDFEARISMGEIPISLIKNTNESIIKEQLRRRSRQRSSQYGDRVAQRKNKLYHQKYGSRKIMQSISSTEFPVDRYVNERPKLFRSPFPLLKDVPSEVDRENFTVHGIAESRETEAPNRDEDNKIASVIHSEYCDLPRRVSGEKVTFPRKEAERNIFSSPWSCYENSSGTNRTPSNEDIGSNSKPPSGNEETETELPITETVQSQINSNTLTSHDVNMLSKSLGRVDRGTSMYENDFEDCSRNDTDAGIGFAGRLLPPYNNMNEAGQKFKDIRTVQHKIDVFEEAEGSDVFVTDNEQDSPIDHDSEGNSSGYGGDISVSNSPDEIENGVVKFDLTNSPCVTLRNKMKNQTKSSDESEKELQKELQQTKNRLKNEKLPLSHSRRKRLNAVTSLDTETNPSAVMKEKSYIVHISPKKLKSPAKRIREKVDCSFEDKSSLKSPSVDELKSFHRSTLHENSHHPNWKEKNNCQCELCLTRKGNASSTASLPHCSHDQCHESISKQFEDVTIDYDWKDVSLVESTDLEYAVTIPDELRAISSEEIKERLFKAGERPGPITETTKNIYIKHLAKIEAGLLSRDNENIFIDYQPELREELKELSNADYSHLEDELSKGFENPQKHKWREGTQKTSFNYILLDPRVTTNLIERASGLTETEIFRCFVRSIFYVGKGKESRPYEHLYDTLKMKKLNEQGTKVSDKLKMILSIWQSGFGVVSLHLFHSIIPVEAYTREACMIETLGLARLTNLKKGEFYGPAAAWSGKKKRQLGIHLLKKALKNLFIEGEKQIKEQDL